MTEWRPLFWKIGYEYARLDETDPKLQNILKLYGKCFDDVWEYLLAGKGRYVHRRKLTYCPPQLYEHAHRY